MAAQIKTAITLRNVEKGFACFNNHARANPAAHAITLLLELVRIIRPGERAEVKVPCIIAPRNSLISREYFGFYRANYRKSGLAAIK